MKVLSSITLLLIACVQSAAPAAVIVKRSSGSDLINLGELNALRKEIGKIGKINYQDLVYDYDLEKHVKSLSNDCDKIEHGENFRVMPMDPDENGAKLMAVFYIGLIKMVTSDDLPPEKITEKMALKKAMSELDYDLQHGKGTVLHFELFNPSQTKIGCAPSKCTAAFPAGISKEDRERLGITGDSASFNSMCALGNSASWPSDVNSIRKAAAKSDSIKALTDPKAATSAATPAGIALALIFSIVFMFL